MLKVLRNVLACAGVMVCLIAHGAETRVAAIADPAAELDRLGRLFGEGTYLRKSAHYLMIYDTPHAWAESRVSLLEGMTQTFYREMSIGGFEPRPLRVRQVAVLFNDHRKYLNYSRTVDGKEADGSGGYYSSRTNRIALFNNQSNPQLRGMAGQIAKAEAIVQKADLLMSQALTKGDANLSQHYRGQKQRALMQLAQMKNQYAGASGRGDVVQTLHEAAHQLAYHSGVMIRGRQYPFWVSEGLATNFETTHPASPHGPRYNNVLRRRDLVSVRRKGAMVGLRDWVLMIKPREKVGEQSDWYAQSWGLFHFLYAKNTAGLRQFMREWGLSRGIERDAAKGLALFEKCFGKIDEVNAEWRAYVREL